jgi:predicted HicB family RNase H-like nuclease
MNNMLTYKGYYGSVEFSDEDNIFFGEVVGIRGLVSYEGVCVKSLKEDFEGAVDDYLEICAEKGIEPQKAYKGSFNVRIKPDLHNRLAVYSATHGMSLNSTVEKAIREFIN